MRDKLNHHCNKPEIGEQLWNWYHLPLGQHLVKAEQAELDRVLPNLFGYHLLQIGLGPCHLLSASRILHQAVMSESCEHYRENCGLCGSSEALPIARESLDALVLYHTLEFADDPRQVLREADQVLVSEGHMVIFGFNPMSSWGVWRLVRKRQSVAPWCGRFINPVRVKDWLALLGFELLSFRKLMFLPPVQQEGILKKLNRLDTLGTRWWPYLGAVYVLVARKKMIAMTPIKPRWRPRRGLVSGLADSASNSMHYLPGQQKNKT